MDAERVEQPVPQSVEAVTEPIASWADASEDILAPEPSLEEAAADTDRAEGPVGSKAGADSGGVFIGRRSFCDWRARGGR